MACKKEAAQEDTEGRLSVPIGQSHQPECKYWRAPVIPQVVNPALPTAQQVHAFLMGALALGKTMMEEQRTISGRTIIPFMCPKIGQKKKSAQLMNIHCIKSNCNLLPCILTRAKHGAALELSNQVEGNTEAMTTD